MASRPKAAAPKRQQPATTTTTTTTAKTMLDVISMATAAAAAAKSNAAAPPPQLPKKSAASRPARTVTVPTPAPAPDVHRRPPRGATEEKEDVRGLFVDHSWVDRLAKELRAQREWSERWGCLNDPKLYQGEDAPERWDPKPVPTKWSAFNIVNAPTKLHHHHHKKPDDEFDNQTYFDETPPEPPEGYVEPAFKITGDRHDHRSLVTPRAIVVPASQQQHTDPECAELDGGDVVIVEHQQQRAGPRIEIMPDPAVAGSGPTPRIGTRNALMEYCDETDDGYDDDDDDDGVVGGGRERATRDIQSAFDIAAQLNVDLNLNVVGGVRTLRLNKDGSIGAVSARTRSIQMTAMDDGRRSEVVMRAATQKVQQQQKDVISPYLQPQRHGNRHLKGGGAKQKRKSGTTVSSAKFLNKDDDPDEQVAREALAPSDVDVPTPVPTDLSEAAEDECYQISHPYRSASVADTATQTFDPARSIAPLFGLHDPRRGAWNEPATQRPSTSMARRKAAAPSRPSRPSSSCSHVHPTTDDEYLGQNIGDEPVNLSLTGRNILQPSPAPTQKKPQSKSGSNQPQLLYGYPPTTSREYGWVWSEAKQGGGVDPASRRRMALESFGSTSANFAREGWRRAGDLAGAAGSRPSSVQSRSRW